MPRTIDEDEVRRYLGSLGAVQTQPSAMPRPKYTRNQLREMIQAERSGFYNRRKEWTDWRPFHCTEEAPAPNRCIFWQRGFRDAVCTIFGTHVSYNTLKAERVCLCSGHFDVLFETQANRLRDAKSIQIQEDES